MADIAFVCSRGFAFTEFELECGMSMATMDAMMEAEEAERNLDADLAHEGELARRHVRGELECPWPWYADAPAEVAEPEVFDGSE